MNAGLGFGEHLVSCGNSWDLHPINTSDPENYYQSLAESHRGPQVIALKNLICVQFHVSPHYPSSILVLNNFVSHTIALIHATKVRVDIPVHMAMQVPSSKPVMKGTPVRGTNIGKHFVEYNQAKHCGFAFSKRDGPLLIGNNATTAQTVKVSPRLMYSRSTSMMSVDKWMSSTESPSSPVKRGRRETDRKDTDQQEFEFVWSPREVREFLHPGYPVEEMPRVMPLVNSITRDSHLPMRKTDVCVIVPYRYSSAIPQSKRSNSTAGLSTSVLRWPECDQSPGKTQRLQAEGGVGKSRSEFGEVMKRASKLTNRALMEKVRAQVSALGSQRMSVMKG